MKQINDIKQRKKAPLFPSPFQAVHTRILPVEVKAIELVLCKEGHNGLGELVSTHLGGGHVRVLLAALVPSSNGDQHLQIGVDLLQPHGSLVRPWWWKGEACGVSGWRCVLLMVMLQFLLFL